MAKYTRRCLPSPENVTSQGEDEAGTVSSLIQLPLRRSKRPIDPMRRRRQRRTYRRYRLPIFPRPSGLPLSNGDKRQVYCGHRTGAGNAPGEFAKSRRRGFRDERARRPQGPPRSGRPRPPSLVARDAGRDTFFRSMLWPTVPAVRGRAQRRTDSASRATVSGGD